MQEHGNTIEEMQKWNQFAATATKHKPFTQRAARACRTNVALGTTKPGWTQHHQVHKLPRIQPRFTIETEVYGVTAVSRCTQQGEIPRTDAFVKLSVAFEQLICTIANIGDKVGGAEHSIREYCGLRTAYTQRSADSRRVV